MQPQVIHISEFTSNKELALMFVENYCLSQIEEMFQKKHPIKNPNLDFFAVADSENNLIIASPEVYVKTGIKSSLQIEDTRHKYPIGFGISIDGIIIESLDEIQENEIISHIFNRIYSSFYTQILKYIEEYKEGEDSQ